MKQERPIIIIVLLLLLTSQGLMSCSPGNLGSTVIAFVRDGQLWTIDPNGANALAIVSQATPVVGYNWSPNHQLLAFRTLDTSFAKTEAAKQLTSNPVNEAIGDVPSTLNTIGVDGGTPIATAFSNPEVRYSNAIWNTTGNRLIYRQTGKMPPRSPENAYWWIAQNDQPGGIAAKTLPANYALPSFDYQNTKAIGISEQGIFTSTLTGSNIRYLVNGPLPGHPLAASLERVLWQPGYKDASILYALPEAPRTTNPASQKVQLLLRTPDGRTKTLATCACTQFAWSPDGNAILYSTGSTYTILNIRNTTSFSVESESGSIPYWSPDSQFLLLDGIRTLIQVNIVTKQQKLLLSDTSDMQASLQLGTTSGSLPAVNAQLQPVANSLWSADSRHFIFLTHNRLYWQGQTLKEGKGLYQVTLDTSGQALNPPAIVDKGNDTQIGWTYQDANTSFLY